jgi:hypothetical protein
MTNLAARRAQKYQFVHFGPLACIKRQKREVVQMPNSDKRSSFRTLILINNVNVDNNNVQETSMEHTLARYMRLYRL